MKDNERVIKFLVFALGLCLAWFVLYDLWLSSFENRLTLMIADASVWFLSLVGYRAENVSSTVYIDGVALVYVGPACNGMVLMALFAGFIIAFPGPLLKKLFYIPCGIIIINILNVVRVAVLALNARYSSQTLDFNHKYTFTVVVYAFIFLLWMVWVKRYSSLNSHATTTSSPKRQAA